MARRSSSRSASRPQRARSSKSKARGNHFADRCRIVVTGGPGGGKTTAADLFRREIGDQVVIVPEAATMLFAGGFPRSEEPHAQRSIQKAIYHVQRNLEDIQSALYPDRILLCDRGTLDGAVYWPKKGGADFFASLDTTREKELSRYDAVIFFQSAAVGNMSIEGGNPTRNETNERACALDAALMKIWAEHPRFILVPHNPSFFKKITFGLAALESIVAQHDARKDGRLPTSRSLSPGGPIAE